MEKRNAEEIALESVLRLKKIDIARLEGERWRAEREAATIKAERADIDLRFVTLHSRGLLTDQEVTLFYYLKTGRQDHFDKFNRARELERQIPPIFKKGEQDIDR